MFEVSKEFSFEAAHSLPHLPEGHKCRNLHGHSYRLLVACKGEMDERGFVVDYAEISEAVNPLLRKLDHQNLNEIFPFKTTAEQIAAWIYSELKPSLPSLDRIELRETEKTNVVYHP